MKRLYSFLMLLMGGVMGFAQTISIVADSHPGELNTNPGSITANSSFFIYSGNDHSWVRAASIGGNISYNTYYDNEAWVSDGTAANTRMVEINSTYTDETDPEGTAYQQQNSASVSNTLLYNDKVYFSANNGTGTYTYYIDGLTGDTVRAADWSITSPSFVVDNKIITRTVSSGPWISWDGVSKPDTLPNQIFNDATLTGSISYGIYLNGKILFSNNFSNDSPNAGTELAIYDPTVETGPVLVDLRSGTSSSSPKHFIQYGNVVYFIATSADGKSSLWVTDGTAGGTAEVPEVKTALLVNATQGTVESSSGMTIFNDKLYFEGDDGTNYDQLYEFDLINKTVNRLTTLVKADGSGAAVNFDPKEYTVLDGTLYLVGSYTYMKDGATTSSTSNAIYKINGSAAEIIEATKVCASYSSLTVFNNKIYCSAIQDNYIDNGDGTYTSSGSELFVFDPNGTPNAVKSATSKNTVHVSPNPSFGYVSVDGLTNANAAYEIHNMGGQLVEQGTVSNGVIDYNVTSGVYLLKVSDGSVSKTLKIVVK